MVSGITSATNNWSSTSQLKQALFNKLDSNKDGVIDKTEITAAMSAGKKRLHGSSKNSPTLDQAFSKVDTNGDGVISPTELSAALSSGAASGLFGGSTASFVNMISPATGSASTNSAAAAQNRSTNSLLKNYLTQVGQMVKQGFTATI